MTTRCTTCSTGVTYNTYFRIDPVEKVVFVLFVQLEFSPRDLELQRGFHDAAVQAYRPARPR